MRSTFKVLFYLKCNAPKKDGLIPVMCMYHDKRQNSPVQLQSWTWRRSRGTWS